MSQGRDEFARIQKDIEAADAALIDALEARARAILEYVELKKREPEGYFPLAQSSETVAVARSKAKAFPPALVEPVLREVLGATASLIAPVRVAYLGPPGGFANAAARGRFGASAELRSLASVALVLDDVERERVSFGVVPLETSSDGALTATLHGLVNANVKMCGELTMQASYHLFSKTGNASDVEKIYAPATAIAACERHLRTQFPKATLLDVPSSQVAAELASEDHGAACVGTDLVGELHSLRLVRERVEDETEVETRFAVVGRESVPRTGTDRTVLALAVHDEPGALYAALRPFADRNINLTRLESRPGRTAAWRYLFFVEMDGHITDRPLLTAVDDLRGAVRFLKVLGSYPRPASASART